MTRSIRLVFPVWREGSIFLPGISSQREAATTPRLLAPTFVAFAVWKRLLSAPARVL